MLSYLFFDGTPFSMYRGDGALSWRCFSAFFCFTTLLAWVPIPHLLSAAQSRFEGRNKWSWGAVTKEVLPIALLTVDPVRYLENLGGYRRNGRSMSEWRSLWVAHRTGVCLCLCCRILFICSYWLCVCYFHHSEFFRQTAEPKGTLWRLLKEWDLPM